MYLFKIFIIGFQAINLNPNHRRLGKDLSIEERKLELKIDNMISNFNSRHYRYSVRRRNDDDLCKNIFPMKNITSKSINPFTSVSKTLADMYQRAFLSGSSYRYFKTEGIKILSIISPLGGYIYDRCHNQDLGEEITDEIAFRLVDFILRKYEERYPYIIDVSDKKHVIEICERKGDELKEMLKDNEEVFSMIVSKDFFNIDSFIDYRECEFIQNFIGQILKYIYIWEKSYLFPITSEEEKKIKSVSNTVYVPLFLVLIALLFMKCFGN